MAYDKMHCHHAIVSGRFMSGFMRTQFRDYARWATHHLSNGIVIFLPWSTTITTTLIFVWLLTFFLAVDLPSLRRQALTAAGGLPLLLFAWALLGLFWAVDTSWAERFAGLREFHKLLFIPLWLTYFRQSRHGLQTIMWFFTSCVALLALSFAVTLWPKIQWWHSLSPGVPFKSYITQSAEFAISAFFLFYLAADAWKQRTRAVAVVAYLLGLAFIANIIFVATSRTELIIIPALIILFGARLQGWKGALASILILGIAGAVAWNSSSYLRDRVDEAMSEIQKYPADNEITSQGVRLEFWRKSIEFISTAPLIGHGTGSIRPLFQQAATGESGRSAAVTLNPHNQIFAVAIQLGLIGVAILCAMWLAHFRLFLGAGLPAWIGLTMVVQNAIGSLFHSHLFDFTEGWMYVTFIGILGSMPRRDVDALQSSKDFLRTFGGLRKIQSS